VGLALSNLGASSRKNAPEPPARDGGELHRRQVAQSRDRHGVRAELGRLERRVRVAHEIDGDIAHAEVKRRLARAEDRGLR